MSQLKYWVWLSMRFGVRPKVKLALVEHFGTPRDVYFATEADYRVRASLRPEELRLLLDKDLHEAERALAICDREDIRVLTIQDAAYPRGCCRSMTRRLVLYVRGTLPPLDDRAAVAVVGYAQRHALRDAHGAQAWLGDRASRRHRALRSHRRHRPLSRRGRAGRGRCLCGCVRARRSIWILRARARRASRAAARS